ncbi:MAG TPA: F0F1 ATP synthase subunit delta [Pseudolysinimonas sp.]|nr:F0F1 ATP synthase subunit delta [Pseudolysinimonas sp.]
MGSASRVALEAAKESLAKAKGVTLATGEQLLSAARDIDGSTQLRQLLADPSIEAAEKSALIRRIFGSLDSAASTLLGELTASRWSNSDQLIDGIEQLGIRAIAASSADSANIEAQLFEVSRAVSSDPDLELALGSTLGAPQEKAALADRLLATKVAPGVQAIVRHLVQSPRGRRIGELLGGAAATVADAGGSFIAVVTAAAPLTAAQLKALTSTLTAQYGREPRVAVRIDPSVIGGLRVRVGDEVIDGTIASRLTELRLQLAG